VARLSLKTREVPGSIPEQPHDNEPSKVALKVEARGGPLVAWSSGVILALGARGPGFNPRSSPTAAPRGQRFSALPRDGAKLCRDPGSNRGPADLQSDALPAPIAARARRLDGPGPSQASNALSLRVGGPKTPGTSATPSAPPGPKKLTRSIKGQELGATATQGNGRGRALPRTTPQPLSPLLCGTVVAKRADWEAPKHLQRRLRSPRAEKNCQVRS
jgi:hypothetical protein